MLHCLNILHEHSSVNFYSVSNELPWKTVIWGLQFRNISLAIMLLLMTATTWRQNTILRLVFLALWNTFASVNCCLALGQKHECCWPIGKMDLCDARIFDTDSIKTSIEFAKFSDDTVCNYHLPSCFSSELVVNVQIQVERQRFEWRPETKIE